MKHIIYQHALEQPSGLSSDPTPTWGLSKIALSIARRVTTLTTETVF